MDAGVARFVRARHGVLTRAEALTLGATASMIRRRLAAGRWERIHPAVYVLAGTRPTWLQALAAACAACDAVASHRAAAALWGLPGFERTIVEVSAPRRRWCHHQGVVAHERSIPPADVTRIEAVPVTTAVRTIVDVASIAGRDVLEVALDDALQRRLVSVRRVREWLSAAGGRGRDGVAMLRVLLDERSGERMHPQSALETRVLALMRRSRLPKPVCQFRVRDGGRLVAVVDFAYPDAGIAIEADGYRWHAGRGQWRHDLERRNRLTALGWRVVHVTWDDLRDRPEAAMDGIRRALAAARGAVSTRR